MKAVLACIESHIHCAWCILEKLILTVFSFSYFCSGLKFAKSLGIARLIVEGDSQLIVRQLTGQYQCREPSLKKYYVACLEVAKDLEYFEIRHIPRSDNNRADWLANHAMDVSIIVDLDRFCFLCHRTSKLLILVTLYTVARVRGL